jgi:PrgI family protein
MATYKVIQDVEAEDKLLGPLTLRQFIYAGIAAISLYLSYFFGTHSAMFMIVVFLPIAAVCSFFAFPWGRDQPTEVWALAKIRFYLKPRRRVWDQSGMTELVSITAPKQLQIDYTNGLTENEVRSRLHALADTIDSRGWAIKNSNLNLYTQPALVIAEPTSDRLVAPSALPQQVSEIDVLPADDILDEKNNPRAQAVDTMIEASAKAHREQIMENLRKNPEPVPPQTPTPKPAAKAEPSQGRPANYWFLNQPARAANVPANMVTFNTQVVTPGMTEAEIPNAPAAPTPDEQSLVETLDAKRKEMPNTAYYSHLHTIQPLSAQGQPAQPRMPSGPSAPMQPAGTFTAQPPVARPSIPQPAPGQITQQVMAGMPAAAFGQQPVGQGVPTIARPVPAPAPPPVTPANQAAILQLANNNDLNVATLAREADRVSPDEVVIKLH